MDRGMADLAKWTRIHARWIQNATKMIRTFKLLKEANDTAREVVEEELSRIDGYANDIIEFMDGKES